MEGRKEGREEGRGVGVIEGKRETLLRLLAAKFGDFREIWRKPKRCPQPRADSVVDRLFTATTLDELELGG
jgi:hypothetical protein